MSSIFDGIGDDGLEQLDENLRKWFKEKWVRFGPDGKIRGACARGSDKEGKPKCLPQSKAHSLGKKGRKYAAAKKRREDPNPERRGKAKNVATKKKSNEEIQVNEKWSQKYKDSINCSNPKGFSQKAHCAGRKKNEAMNEGIPFNQCPGCRGPIVHESMMNEKKDACYHKVKARYKVWPSAYASGALVQCRKKGASNWGTGGKKNESSIMKGIVDESENVLVLYIDGKPSTKYAKDHEAKSDLERLQAKFPNKKFELKREMREGVIIGHDANDPDVAVLGGAGSYKLSNLKKKAQMEANELAKDVGEGKFKNSAYNVKQLANTLNTIVAAEEEMEKKYFGEDYTGEFAAEKTAATNPYGGQKDRQHRGAISETPTDNPTGASGEGGWRKYKPKSAGEIDEAKKSEFRLKAEQQQLTQLEKINNSTLPHWAKEYLTLLTDPKGKVFKAAYYSFGKGQDARKEAAEYIMQKYKIPQEWIDKINFLKGSHVTKNREEDRHFNWDMPSMHEDTSYAGGGGQGGNAGESYRKFKPKSAGTFKEGASELEAFLTKYPEAKDAMRNAVRHFEYAYDAMDHVAGHVLHKMPYSEFSKVRQDLIDYFTKYGLKGDVNEEELDEACWKGYHKEGMKTMFGKKYPNCVKNTNEEEQLDEKCWDSHKQVGMKKKNGKMVPNCVPKESAIMKGLKR